MFTMVFEPLRQWWQAAIGCPLAPLAAARADVPLVIRRRVLQQQRRDGQHRSHQGVARGSGVAPRPLTPFVDGSRHAARRFWMTTDPKDQRRAALGGSFAEVCGALERLAAGEEAGCKRVEAR